MDFSIYFHWPFCESICPYCDFNVHVRDNLDYKQWEQAYLTELDYWAEQTRDRCVSSVYFGGGTPSLMPPELVANLIARIKKNWTCKDDLEITLEANPSSFEIDRFRDFREAGINRVSIGVQSFRDDVLQFLGRPHSAPEAKKAVAQASNIFDRMTFDLIFSHPLHTPDQWETEISEWLKLTKGHISTYQLSIEKGTPFYLRHQRGEFDMPDDEIQANFYDITCDLCDAHGLHQYEISNFSAKEQESQHNLNYWHMNDYLGIGAGAHGRVTLDNVRYATVGHRAPEIWLKRVLENNHGNHPFIKLSDQEIYEEKIMMGLRMNKGIKADEMLLGNSKAMIDMNFLIYEEGYIKASRQGRLHLNTVINHILTA